MTAKEDVQPFPTLLSACDCNLDLLNWYLTVARGGRKSHSGGIPLLELKQMHVFWVP